MRFWRGQQARPLRRDMPRATPSIVTLVAGVAGVLVCVALLSAWLLWDARRIAWEHAAQSSATIAATVEHDITYTFELYDLSLQSVVDGLKLPGINVLDPTMRKEVLFDRAATARYLGPLQVVDETGKVIIDSRRPTPPDDNFADHPFFHFHRNQPALGPHIGAPFKAPASGVWSLSISRRVNHPDGSFAGVVVGTLRLDFFGQLFSLIDAGPGGSVALFHADGTLIDRAPYHEKFVGRELANFGLFQHYPDAKTGVFTGTSAIDGIERLYAYRQIDHLPLVLVVGRATETVFAPWRQKAIGIAIIIVALSAMAAVMGAALVRELHRRDRAERTALENERRYRLLAEQSFDMIVRFDPRTQQRAYVSPGCRRLYGYEPEEALALSAEQVIHPDDLPGVSAALARLDGDAEQPPIRYRGRRRDGSYVWVEASLMRSQNPDTGAVEIVSIVRDVGERIRYEAALHQAKDEADSANRSKSQFIATMSHELRTPLNAILGFTEIMQREVMGPIGNETYKSYIADIHVSGAHLLQLINDILDLTKAEAGMLELNEETIDLEEIIRAVVRISRASVEKAKLAVDIDLQSGLPLLRADERKVRQVLFNLIGNAVKFTPAGGSIAIRARFDRQAGMRMTVADTGIGIAPENLQRVMEPFVQIDNSLSRNHPGTGLGLPAVKAIMEVHGGTLTLSSTIGAGTEATVTFPPERAILRDPQVPARSAA
ncbi:MAG TPA: ATP-binding protein [Stellaceae bacterium]|nr:ATP-binding protein [Stellaceae bacterium]